MKLSTQIARMNTKQKIMDLAVEFAKAYAKAEPSEVSNLYKAFSQEVNITLKIK